MVRRRPPGPPALPSPPAVIAARPSWIDAYVALLARRGWAFALFWLTLTAAGLLGVVNTFSNLKLQIEPIPGDANDVAASALRSHFPDAANRQLTLVELRATASSSANGTTLADITKLVSAREAADRLGRFAAPYIASGLISPDSGARRPAHATRR